MSSKGNSGKRGSKIPVAKTISEANAIAVRLGLADRADFTGIDLSHANLMIQRLAEIRQQFPVLEKLQFIGNSKFLSKRSKAAAIFHSALGVPLGLTLVEKFWNSSNMIKFQFNLNNSVNIKESPIGCNTFKSVIDHEIGHYLDYGRVRGTSSTNLQLSRDEKILNLYRDLTRKKITDGLSSYATKNIREFIAEAWAEYQNNPTPRPIAKTIGDRIKEVYQVK